MKNLQAQLFQVLAVLFIVGNFLYNCANSLSIETAFQQQVIAISGVKGLLWGIFFMLAAIVSMMESK